MTAAEHIRKAAHNEAFIASLELSTTPFLDWAVTGVFYAALHYIRALAAANLFANVTSYGEMDKLFATLAPLKRRPGLYGHYRFLKDESREARYETRRFKAKDISSILANDLQPIKSYVLSQIS